MPRAKATRNTDGPERDDDIALEERHDGPVVWVDSKLGGPLILTRNVQSPEPSADGRHQLTTRKVVLVPGINTVPAEQWAEMFSTERQAYLERHQNARLSESEEMLADGRLRILERGWQAERSSSCVQIAGRSSNTALLQQLAEAETRETVLEALRKQLSLIREKWDPTDVNALKRAHASST